MDWDAKLYDERHGFVGTYGNDLVKLVHDTAKARPAGSSAPRILDIGCGTDAHLEALSAIGPVVGIDSSPAMVDQARTHHPHADIRLADACALPFKEEFDIVFSNAAFHWIPDQLLLLENVAGSLVANGVLVAEMGAKGNVTRIEEGYAHVLRQHGIVYTPRFHFPQESSYRKLMETAGFEVIAVKAFDRPTVLSRGYEGLRHWAEQFFASSLSSCTLQERDAMFDDLERICEPTLWDAERACWVADYRRLRFVARKASADPKPYSP